MCNLTRQSYYSGVPQFGFTVAHRMRKDRNMDERQTWVITFNSDSEDVNAQADILEEFFLDGSADIDVTQRPVSELTQGGWVDLLITWGGSGGVLTVAITAISLFFKYTHSASINIEIQEDRLTKFEAKNITSKNVEKVLQTIERYVKSREKDEEEKEKKP